MRPFIFPVRRCAIRVYARRVIAYNRGPRRGSNWRGLEFSLPPFLKWRAIFLDWAPSRGFLLSEWKGADGPLFSFKDGLLKCVTP
jgi:hypothetical protein